MTTQDNSAPRRPPRETVAEVVKMQRAMAGWKQDTLAAMARVSLSTVQRVERGEAVRDRSLEQIADAVGLKCGAFTEPRLPLSDDEVHRLLVESMKPFFGKKQIDVAPLKFEHQVRALASGEVGIVDSDLGDDADDELAGLREWFDLVAFVRGQDGAFMPKRERSFRLRKLYKDVMDNVADIERRYKAVCLIGVYEAKSNLAGFETIRVAVIALRSRDHNPASGAIRQLWADEFVDARTVFQTFINGDE